MFAGIWLGECRYDVGTVQHSMSYIIKWSFGSLKPYEVG